MSSNPYRPPATDAPGGPPPRARWSGTIAGLLAIYLVETQLVGLFLVAVLGGLIALPTVVLGARRRREPWRIAGLKAAAVAAMIAAAIGTNLGNLALAQHRAERVVEACERFRAAKGRFPAALEELVPRYLASVPRAKLTVAWGRFWYMADPDGSDPLLMYVRLPPFGRVLYNFQKRRWSHLD